MKNRRNTEKKTQRTRQKYCFLELFYKHNIYNSCDLTNYCFTYLINPQTLSDTQRTFFVFQALINPTKF